MVIDAKTGKRLMLRGLLDSGCSKSIVLKRFTTKNTRVKLNKENCIKYETYNGYFRTSSAATLQLRLVEFNKYKDLTVDVECQVDEVGDSKKSSYDIILGSDFMHANGIVLNYHHEHIKWHGENDDYDIAPMKERGALTNKEECALLYQLHTASPILQEEEERHARILDADYSAVDIDSMVGGLDIPKESKRKLTKALKKFSKTIFGGGLGTLQVKPVDLELEEGAKPYASRYYNIPKAYEEALRKEIARLCEIGVLEKLSFSNDSEWAAATFCQPKKTGDIRVLTDFREVNKRIRRKPFPLPRINESMQKLEKFKCATAIDLSQGYYHIPLSEESQRICTTVLPWGKYSYKRLAMGIASAPDIFQSIMMDVLGDLDFVLCYLDDILVLQKEGESEDDHIRKIEMVLQRLEDKGFKANLRKSFFMQKEIEYLGFQLTANGIAPQPKKVDAMLRIEAPTNRKQLKRFLGMVNFYRDVWPKRSHTLAPLTRLAGGNKKSNYVWGPKEQAAFEEAKRMLKEKAVLAFPDFSKPFDLYSDASDIQLGATLVQEGKPLGFYTRKLNKAQQAYTVGEREMLGIVEGCKAFEGVLLGMDVTIHTDHLNLLYKKLPSQRLIRWRLLLEEFHPKFVHVAGKDNDAADALSRLEMKHNKFDEVSWEPVKPRMKYADRNGCKRQKLSDGATEAKEARRQMELCKAMNEMAFEAGEFDEEDITPLDAMKHIDEKYKECEFEQDVRMFHYHQGKDEELAQRVAKDKAGAFSLKKVEGVLLLHENSKIVVPTTLKERVMDWYHYALVHPGVKRMEESIRLMYTWKGLRKDVKECCRPCDKCQRCKTTRKVKYGLLPEKEGEVVKWSRVNVDLWGPKSIVSKNGYTYQLHIMTMVDPVTGWFEMAQLYEGEAPTAKRCQEILDTVWLSRYPRPKEIGFDNGGEFKKEFAQLCRNMGMKQKVSLPWNPQSNSVLERMHQILADCLRTFELEEKEIDSNEADPFEEYLAQAAYAIRCGFHATHGRSPAELVFGRNMFLPVESPVDWEKLKDRKQRAIARSNKRENSKRIEHEYKPGDWVTILKPGILRKMTVPRMGPFKVVKHHTNGTLTYEKAPFDTDRVNIRRCEPYHWKHPPE